MTLNFHKQAFKYSSISNTNTILTMQVTGMFLMVLVGMNIHPAHCDVDEMKIKRLCVDALGIVSHLTNDQDESLQAVAQLCKEGNTQGIQEYLNSEIKFIGGKTFTARLACKAIRNQLKPGNHSRKLLSSMKHLLQMCDHDQEGKAEPMSSAELYIAFVNIMAVGANDIVSLSGAEIFCKDIHRLVSGMRSGGNVFDHLTHICSKSGLQRSAEIDDFLTNQMNYDKLPFPFDVPEYCSGIQRQSEKFEINPQLNTSDGNLLTSDQKKELLGAMKAGLGICEHKITHKSRAAFFIIVVHIMAINKCAATGRC